MIPSTKARLARFIEHFRRGRVVVYADFIDPFCYIGVATLEQALAEQPSVAIDWRGFELNPETPPEGYHLETGGNSDLRPGMWASVRALALQAGLEFPEPQFVPNTLRAHQLLAGIGESAAKKSLIRSLYQAYFLHGQNIGQDSCLIRLAASAGISEVATGMILRDDRLTARVQAYREEAKAACFPGMPGFAYRGRHYFGALSKSAWLEILNP